MIVGLAREGSLRRGTRREVRGAEGVTARTSFLGGGTATGRSVSGAFKRPKAWDNPISRITAESNWGRKNRRKGSVNTGRFLVSSVTESPRLPPDPARW